MLYRDFDPSSLHFLVLEFAGVVFLSSRTVDLGIIPNEIILNVAEVNAYK